MFVRDFFAASGDPVKAAELIREMRDEYRAAITCRVAYDFCEGDLESNDPERLISDFVARYAPETFGKVMEEWGKPSGPRADFLDLYFCEFSEPRKVGSFKDLEALFTEAAYRDLESQLLEHLEEVARVAYCDAALARLDKLSDCEAEVDAAALESAIESAASRKPWGPWDVSTLLQYL